MNPEDIYNMFHELLLESFDLFGTVARVSLKAEKLGQTPENNPTLNIFNKVVEDIYQNTPALEEADENIMFLNEMNLRYDNYKHSLQS